MDTRYAVRARQMHEKTGFVVRCLSRLVVGIRRFESKAIRGTRDVSGFSAGWKIQFLGCGLSRGEWRHLGSATYAIQVLSEEVR